MTDKSPLEVPRGPRRGDRFTVVIDRLTDKGLGLGQLTLLVGPGRQHLQYSVEVRDALPSEEVEVEVMGRYRRVLRTELVQSLRLSADRVTPFCRHYGSARSPGKGCGGCSVQHLSLAAQRAQKQRLVQRCLQQVGLSPRLVSPVMDTGLSRRHRNKMEFSFGNDADRSFSLGLHPAGYRYQTLALSECWLLSEQAADFVPAVAAWAQQQRLQAHDPRRGEGLLRTLTLREGQNTNERMVVLETEAGGEAPDDLGRRFVQLCRQHLGAGTDDSVLASVYWLQRHARRGSKTSWSASVLYGKETYSETLRLTNGRQLRFEIGPRSFFQPSTPGAETIYAEVLRQASGEDGIVGTALDLYCGTGTIGLCLAPLAHRVIGVELNEEAVSNARQNAARNSISNIAFHAGDAAAVLRRLALRRGEVDTVVVDPPRAGLQPGAITEIAGIGAQKIVYVACRPASLARDAAALAAHGYKLTAVQPIDQFPWTMHVECVATLVRQSQPSG